MQSRFRLSEDKRFSQIHQEGRSIANSLLVVRVLRNELDHNRYGFMVGKRLGNAVTRNRIKRRLREVVRMAKLEDGWDAVFIVRKGAENANYDQLKSAVENVLQRADLLDKSCEKETL